MEGTTPLTVAVVLVYSRALSAYCLHWRWSLSGQSGYARVTSAKVLSVVKHLPRHREMINAL